MRIFATSLLLAGLLVSAAGAQEDIDWIYVWTIYPDDAIGARLFVTPDGQGSPFTAAFAEGGGQVDATVQIIMTTYSYVPIVGFPAEDMWLASSEGGLVACQGGIIADGPTDDEGAAYWTQLPRAGGNTVGEVLHGVINGFELATEIPLTVVSPDLNGSLDVNLSDIVEFTEAIAGAPGWDRSDFNNDHQITLTDIVLFTPAIGATCP